MGSTKSAVDYRFYIGVEIFCVKVTIKNGYTVTLLNFLTVELLLHVKTGWYEIRFGFVTTTFMTNFWQQRYIFAMLIKITDCLCHVN